MVTVAIVIATPFLVGGLAANPRVPAAVAVLPVLALHVGWAIYCFSLLRDETRDNLNPDVLVSYVLVGYALTVLAIGFVVRARRS